MEEYLYNSSIDAFLCKLINIDEDNNNNFLSSFYQLRIFKNRFDFSYVGTIHEQLKIKAKLSSWLHYPIMFLSIILGILIK